MIVLGLTTFLATTLLAGFGITMLLLRSPARLSAIEFTCLSWLLGTGVVSFLLWIAGSLLHGFALASAIGILAAALGILGGIRIRSSREVKLFCPRPAGAVEWLLVVCLLMEILMAFFVSWKNPLGWDGSFNWENKARIAFLSGGSIPGSYYSSSSQTLSHPEYPLLIPFTELWMYLCVGEAHQFLAKIVFPIFFVATVSLCAVFGGRYSNRRWAGMLAAALLAFVPAVVRHSGGVASGYVDLPLSAFYVAAIGYLALFNETGDTNMFRLSAAALTFLPWIKAEGAILWLVGAACAMIICLRRKRIVLGLCGILPGAVIAGTWQLFLHRMSTNAPHDFVSVNASTFWANLDRIPSIASLVFTQFGHLNNWSLFWLLVLVAIAYRVVRAPDRRLLLLTATMVLPIAAYSASYIFSSWPNFQDHVAYSVGRLLLHVTPIGVLCVAMALPSPAAAAINGAGTAAETI